MPIVSDGQLNLAALQVDDVYVVIVPPQTPVIPGFPTDGIGLVGSAIKGPLNKPLLVGTPQDLLRLFGDITTHPNDLVTEALGAMKQGANNIYAVRVSDGTHATATGAGFDGTGVAGAQQLLTLSAFSPGSWANDVGGGANSLGGVKVVIDTGSAAIVGAGNVLAATDTIVVGGTAWAAGQTITITIGGVSAIYTVTATDVAAGAATAATFAAIAGSIANAINGGFGTFLPLSRMATASSTAATVTLTLRTKGIAGNVVTLATATSNGTGTVAAGSAVFVNGTGVAMASTPQTAVAGGGITNVATTLNVTSTTGFPAVGVLLVDSEVITYTGVTATSFTGLARGAYNGGAGAAHSAGAVVGLAINGQSYKVTISSAYDSTEIFDNISGTFGPATLSGSLVSNLINAINNGLAGIRGSSQVVTAAGSGSSTGIVINQLIQLGSAVQGADGRGSIAAAGTSPTGNVPAWTNTITTAAMLGVDGLTRTGMFALRGTTIFQFGLAGLTDPNSWSTQIQFAASESLVVVLGVAASTSSQNAVSTKVNAAIDEYHALMVKDFVYLNDTFNKVIRLVSPIGATLGRIAGLSPERSPGNKAILGYLGTERTGFASASGSFVAGIPYSAGEIGLLEQNGILFMTQPAVGGGYLALRHGQNTSSDPTRNGTNYSRMTLFLARSLLAAFGFAINEVHTPELRRRVASSLSQFLGSLADPGPGRSPMIGDVNGGPAYSIVCDASNNPSNLVAQGYLYVTVQVKYLSIVRFFILSVEAGQTVTVRVQQSPVLRPAAQAA